MIRTLILLLRHAAQAVETWWRGATADFVESDIAFNSFNHLVFSYHRQVEDFHFHQVNKFGRWLAVRKGRRPESEVLACAAMQGKSGRGWGL